MRHPAPAEELRTDRLVVRKLQASDATAMFRAIEANRAHLAPWLTWLDKTRTIEDVRFKIDIRLDAWQSGTAYDFGVFSHTGEFLGRCGLHSIDWSVPRGEFGYWLVKKAEGQGLLAEALTALELEFFRLGFERLEVRCDTANQRSHRVPERLGYLHEGTLRREVRHRGQLRDTMVWAKLRR